MGIFVDILGGNGTWAALLRETGVSFRCSHALEYKDVYQNIRRWRNKDWRKETVGGNKYLVVKEMCKR